MEWNEMHAPLDPPAGYEHYATAEQAFPAMYAVKPFESWQDFVQSMKAAWKLYRHHYIPDPDILAQEEKERQESERANDARIKRARESVVSAHGVASDAFSSAVDHVNRHIPKTEEDMAHRLNLTQQAIKEFGLGFSEASSGAVDIFGKRLVPPDALRDDNKPVLYAPDSDDVS